MMGKEREIIERWNKARMREIEKKKNVYKGEK